MTWTRAEDDDLAAIFEAVARPWPAALARLWLRHAEGAAAYSRSYWLPKDSAAQIVASMQRRDPPGRRALAHVAGWGEKQARTVLELGAWRDPFATPASEGPALGQPGARVRARVGPASDEKSTGSIIPEGPALGQPGATLGARVGPDRARVSLDPNPNPRPKPEDAPPTVEPSPPPAEPSGSPADRWMAAAEELDPDGWRDDLPTALTEEFQPSSDAYVFEDALPTDIGEQPSNPRHIESPATRAPEAPPQGPRPSPTRPGNGEGATGPRVAPPRPSAAQPSLWPAGGRPGSREGEGNPPAPDASGGPVAGAPAAKAKRTPKEAPTPREPAPPVELDHPDDPCPLLLGGKVSIDHLTADIVEVYRSWWRRQLSPATCRLTVGRLGLIRQALGTYEAAQLVHLIRYAYEAADLGKFGRAWRGDNGQTPPDLEMLLRGEHVARNVEMAGRWSVERVPGAPPAAGPAPSNVHPFQMPPPPAPRAPFRKATTAELMQALANM